MTTIDHQQAAVDSIRMWLLGLGSLTLDEVNDLAPKFVTAAAPHLRAGMAEELLDDTPGSPLTRGYQRLMDPKTGEHPVRTWEAAVRVMLDTLLEGGGEDK